jgi:DNA-binding response OmpR family regulator
MSKKRLMLVEDDINLGNLIFDNLEIYDYDVTLYRNGEEAWNNFEKGKFDMLLLDIMMPKRDGLSLAKEIRKVDMSIPIIFLTAKSLKEDKIQGFNVGADDYLTKPFEMEELFVRMEAIFRRSQKGVNVDGIIDFKLGKYNFNLINRTLTGENETHKLTTKEAGLLEQLCIQQNGILTREIALKAVWGCDNYFTGRSMDVYITKVRKYLSGDPSIEIQNIHGEGYKLIIHLN